MPKHLQNEIDKLKKQLLSLSSVVEGSLEKAIRSVNERDTELAKELIENDHIIDTAEVEVEEEFETMVEEEVEGELCDGVKVDSDKHRSVKLLFSRKTGLLLKTESQALSEALGKEVLEEAIFTDYRDVDGTKTSFKSVVKQDGKVFLTSEATEFSYPKEADASWFSKP